MRKVISLALLTGVFASISVADTSVGPKWVTAPQSEPAYISFTFDDATVSQFTTAFPILAQHGIPATVYVNSGPLDVADPSYMSWQHVRILSAAGWEVGGHTVTHRPLPELSDLEIVGEIVLSNKRIAEETGLMPRSFASPFDAYDERVLALIASFYQLHVRGWGEDGGLNEVTDFDPLFLKRVNVDGTLTADDICGKVRSVQEGQWLILMFHQVATQDGPYVSSPEQVRAITECVAESALQRKVIVDTVSAVYDHINKE